ncbi:MAG: hypothetical protein IPO08_23150 [Xanthomonadales bacterium]|nr:hypothetical protein [Xanthomonadales bacterium]
MGRVTTLNEGAMQTAELQIPQLATEAGRAAYGRAIANHSAPLVVTSACGLVGDALGGWGRHGWC